MGCLKSIENDELINEDFDNKKINEFTLNIPIVNLYKIE